MDVALFIAGFAEVIVLVVVIAGSVGGKNEPDPGGERPLAIYLAAAVVVATFTLFAGIGMTAGAIAHLAEDNDGGYATTVFSDEEFFDSSASAGDNDAQRNSEITELVLGVIVLAVGAGVLAFHDPKQRRMAQNSDGPGLRVAEKTTYILCFSALLALVGAGAAMIYSAYGAIAPGVSGVGDRDQALRDLITPVLLFAAAAGIFIINWNRAPHRLMQPAAYSAQHSA